MMIRQVTEYIIWGEMIYPFVSTSPPGMVKNFRPREWAARLSVLKRAWRRISAPRNGGQKRGDVINRITAILVAFATSVCFLLILFPDCDFFFPFDPTSRNTNSRNDDVAQESLAWPHGTSRSPRGLPKQNQGWGHEGSRAETCVHGDGSRGKGLGCRLARVGRANQKVGSGCVDIPQKSR